MKPRTGFLLTLTTCTVALPLSALAEPLLIEKIDNSVGGIVIPYAKYVLPNGLTVVIHEDHSDPVAHVDVTYHVGSAREEIGKSGFAHFFEHMMFQGSDHIGDDEHFKIVSESGGRLNGSTNRDRTNYYETVPGNQVEKMLWMEADRMGFFLDAVTQKKFEIQRDTVKNERGQNYDNRPYGLVWEMLARNMYPYGHPYSWLTIGYLEDLNRVNVDDLKNFFLRWYGPNNATLSIGGDVVTGEVIKQVEKYFGSIPRGPEVKRTEVPPATLEKDRHITLVDNYARIPQLVISFPSVPAYHPDDYPLDFLAEILGQGKNSLLYQQLVKDKRALRASASNSASELGGEFTFTIVPAPGVSLADTKKLYDEAIMKFEARGVTEDDLSRLKGASEAELIRQLQSVSGKTAQLAAYQTFTGNPNQIGSQLQKYNGVTREDILRVYKKYLQGRPAVILGVVTKADPSNVVAPENYTVSKDHYEAPDYGYVGLKYVKPKDSFDRSKMPTPGANPVVKVPPFWTEELSSGVKVIGAESRELPMIAMTISIPGGHLLAGSEPQKAGLAQMFGEMMDEDTQVRTAEEFQAELEKLGSTINVSAGFDDIEVSVEMLKKNVDKTLELLEERLLKPNFTQAAFERIKRQTLESFKSRKSQPSIIAGEVFARINYGPENILGVRLVGTEETVNNLTLQDTIDYYKRFITAKGAKLAIVGDISQKEIIPKLGFLSKLPVRDIQWPKTPAAPPVEKTRIYVVDVPKAAQTYFQVGYVTGLKYDATGEYYRAGLLNYPLGGLFNSRLNMNLREDKGWTYGARSGFNGDKYTGTFSFSSGIRTDATADALKEVLNELGKYGRSGPTREEIQFTQSAIGQRDALQYETPIQKAGFIRRILEYNLPADFVEKQNRILAKLDAKELNQIASKWIQTNALNIVLVGDKTKILPSLEPIGYEIVELDVNGDKVRKPL